MKEFANHRLYDKSGRRLAIFGRIEGNTMEFFVLTCSKYDKFSRKLARKVWNLHVEGQPLVVNSITYKPLVFNVIVATIEFSKNFFLSLCNQMYCKQYPIWEIIRYEYMTDSEAEQLLIDDESNEIV
jgi:hypothetical protein